MRSASTFRSARAPASEAPRCSATETRKCRYASSNGRWGESPATSTPVTSLCPLARIGSSSASPPGTPAPGTGIRSGAAPAKSASSGHSAPASRAAPSCTSEGEGIDVPSTRCCTTRRAIDSPERRR